MRTRLKLLKVEKEMIDKKIKILSKKIKEMDKEEKKMKNELFSTHPDCE